MNIIWSLTILLGLIISFSKCCTLKNGRRCRFSDPFSDPSLFFAGRIVFDTPTGTLSGKPKGNEKHIIVIQQPRSKKTGFSHPIRFGGSGLGKVRRVPESNSATFCKASPLPDSDCFLPPGPPRNFRVDVNTRKQREMKIIWDKPAVTNGYIFTYEIRYRAIERSYDSNFQTEYFQGVSVLAHALQKLEYLLENLDPSTKYEIQLSASTFIKKGPCVTITGSTGVVKDLKKVDVNALPPVNRTVGDSVVIYLPPLTQKYATGYIIRVYLVRGRKRTVEENYRAAFINKSDETTEFVVGDGNTYGVYVNRPLLEDEDYEIYIGVVSIVGKEEVVTWSDPIFIEAYVKKPFPLRLVLIVALLAVTCIISATAIFLVWRRTPDKKRNKKRNRKGNRRNVALPEIPQDNDGERYKLFTASTKSQASGFFLPTFDPYGVDYARGDEIKNGQKVSNGVSTISKGIDVARIQGRRLPEKPPPIPDDNFPLTQGTYVKSQNLPNLGRLTEGAAAETDGMTKQFYRSKDSEIKKPALDLQDEYDDTDVEKGTENRKRSMKKERQSGMAMSMFSRLSSKKKPTSFDFGDMYDDTDLDKATEGKGDRDMLSRPNENRYSKFGATESRASAIYEDTLGSQESSLGSFDSSFGDVYEETGMSTGDDFYDDTEEPSVDRKTILQEPSTDKMGVQNHDSKKREKIDKTRKIWFKWKSKDVPVTENLGKNNSKVVLAAKVSPLEDNRKNYSGHLYPPSSIKIDETPMKSLGSKHDDDDQFNDIYEDTTEMGKNVTLSRPPSTLPQPIKTSDIIQKWKGKVKNNTAQIEVLQPNGKSKPRENKDYGEEYDETVVDSNSNATITAMPPVSVHFPSKPVQVVTPSCNMAGNSKTDCHGKTCDEYDEDMYEDTGGLETYDDTCLLDNDELYEAI